MDIIKNIAVPALVAVLVVVGIALFNGPDEGGTVKVGGLGGDVVFPTTFYADIFTRGGLTYGDGVATLTDANGGTYTLTQAELLGSSYLKFASGGAGQAVVALTFPATSTMTDLIPQAGDCREWIYDATDLAAATTTTITAGTGIDVVAYTTNDDVIDGAELAEIRMCRQPDTDVTLFTTEILHAD